MYYVARRNFEYVITLLVLSKSNCILPASVAHTRHSAVCIVLETSSQLIHDFVVSEGERELGEKSVSPGVFSELTYTCFASKRW
jgi:hypothetical protein